MPDGTIYCSTPSDAAGNWSSAVSTTFIKDTLAPTTSGLTVTPGLTNVGPAIGASVSDTASGSSKIVAAEYFIDATGTPGTGTALSGTFTSPTVSVSGTITMSSATFNALSQGTHTIYVEGEDAAKQQLGAAAGFVLRSSRLYTLAPTTSGF